MTPAAAGSAADPSSRTTIRIGAGWGCRPGRGSVGLPAMNPMIAFLLAGATAAAPADAPLQAATADRGEVKAGPLLTHTFTLTHRGAGKLVVTGVEGGCGCVRAAVSRGELQPGESAELAVEINTLTQPEG